MGAGRFLCVSVPLGLTFASMVCILIAMLSGVTNKNLDMFQADTANLSISSSSLENLANLAKREAHFSDLTTAALSGSVSSSTNITAADLGLADTYKVNMWNYCYSSGKNTTCTKAKFNWAASALNTTAIEALATSTAGVNVTLPTEMKDSLKTFIVFSKWTEVVYIIAFIASVIELVLGVFAICSRAGSCITSLASGFATTTIIAASIMATVQSSIVVAALKSTAKAYGVNASLNTSFLAVTWLAVAFSIAGGLFWMFTTCCCAADHSKSPRNRRSRGDYSEKLIPTGAYHPIQDPNTAYVGQQHGIYNPPQAYGIPMQNKPVDRAGAYEPYSHAAI